MTLHEALYSGKRFRLQGGTWYEPHLTYAFSTYQIMQSDWEVEELAITVKEIRAAVLEEVKKEISKVCEEVMCRLNQKPKEGNSGK